jgi:hypothetical protein
MHAEVLGKPIIVAKWITLLNSFRKLPDSNLDPHTG